MEVRVLQTKGHGNFKEVAWNKPDITQDQIEVQAVMTGVCRSDIDMMLGNFKKLPIEMQGHEGLGIVAEVGANVTDVVVGDYVATRGEPAYADYYNASKNSYVKVPELHQRYIIEPVACGVNVVTQAIREIAERSGPGKKLLINGSGFLAWVAYRTIQLNHLEFDIDVVGSHNQKLWGNSLMLYSADSYDVIIDLSSHGGEEYKFNDNALLIAGATKSANSGIDVLFNNLLWRAGTIIFPSPRNPKFHECMRDAVRWVQNGDIRVDEFWSTGYNRETNWKQAFADGVDRPTNYSRGFIYWKY